MTQLSHEHCNCGDALEWHPSGGPCTWPGCGCRKFDPTPMTRKLQTVRGRHPRRPATPLKQQTRPLAESDFMDDPSQIF